MRGSDASGESHDEAAASGRESEDATAAEGSAEPEALAEENARLRAELEAMSPAVIEAKRVSRHRLRKVIALILVGLTSAFVVFATVGVWTQRTLADTDRYVALVAPLSDDPAVTNPLAARLTDEIFAALDVQGRVQEAIGSMPILPQATSLLAGPITSAAHSFVEDQVKSYLASDAFGTLWSELNAKVHEKVQALLNGDYEELPNVAINGGEVQLNLVSVAAEVIRRLTQGGIDALGIDVTIPQIPPSLDGSAAIQRLSSALGVTLPPDFGQVTILTVDQLDEYQATVRSAKRLVGLLVVSSLVLLAATLLVAPNRRRAVVWLGIGIAGALFLGGIFLRRIRTDIVDSIDGSGAKAAAQDVFGAVGASLRRAGLLVLVIAVLAAIVAYVAGRPRWIESARAWRRRVTDQRPEGSELDVWVAAHAAEVRIGGIALAAIVLFLTGIDWLPVALVAALVGLLLWGVSSAERRVGAAPPSGEAPPSSEASTA